MSSQLDELYAKVSADAALRDKFAAASGLDEVLAIAADLGYVISVEDLVAYQSAHTTDLSDVELEQVAGGACSPNAQTVTTTVYFTDNCY